MGSLAAIVTDATEVGATPGDVATPWRGRYAAAMARIIVDVMLKPEIRDPQGEAVTKASQRLGFGQVLGVRQGKRFEVEVSGDADETALARVRELAGELLANPVIEEFIVHAG